MALSILDLSLLGFGFWLVRRYLNASKSSLPLPPGPKGLPLVGNVLDLPTVQPHKTFAEWGTKYGGIVYANALGQPIVIINDVKIAVDLLDKKSALYSDRPTLRMAGELTGWEHSLVLQHYGDRLKEYRRYIHRFLGTRTGIESFHPLFESEARALLKHMIAAPDAVQENLRRAAGAIIMKMSYGYDTRDIADPIVDLVDLATTQFSELMQSTFLVDFLPFLKYVPAWFPGAGFQRKALEHGKVLQDMAEVPLKFVQKEIAAGTAPPSFVADLIEESNGTNYEVNNIKWAAASLYSGGADTTVSTMYTFFLTMTLFPEAQKKAQAEIDAVIGHDRLPCMADRPNLPYVEALVSEVLRWGPVGPMGIAHRLMEDDVYNGYLIPKGSIVMPNAWNMLHDPAVYENPLDFNPDRFIARPGKPAEQDPRICCFGFGRRVCPGLNLADATVWLESAMALATLNISKAVENGVEITPEGKYLEGTIAHPEPFKCSIKPRSPQAEALVRAE
ncbi:cytochrome P450 [Amylostereum chailletii]|nr:cytochrome P450 [Amylostereum chailletii]